jgi:4-hydroxyphenylpyruvate dioxygenase-like putative hemolysin
MALIPAVALDHVGIAAPRGVTALSAALGDLYGSKLMPSGVEVGRFGPERALELVWPQREQNPVAGFLERHGPGLHHIALRVDVPLAELAERLRPHGIASAGAVEPAADGRPSLFLHPRGTDGVLVELVEGPRP